MTSRPSGIRPPHIIPSRIPPPTLAVQGINIASSLPRPSGLPTMKSNPTVPLPYDSPIHFQQPGTPQSGTGSGSQKDMESWDSGLRRYSDADGRRNSEVLTEDTDSFIIGDVVWVGGAKRGKIAYIGETQFAKGEWAGVVLDAPVGKNDGMVSGIRYFQCDPMHGTFTRLTRLTRQPLPPYDTEDCYVHGNTPPRCFADYRRSPSPFRSKSPSPGPMTPRLGSPSPAARIGDRVIVQSSSGTKRGILRFIGNTMFAPGEWAGIELDQPIGKNDGSVGIHRYFSCPDKYGLFAPISKVSSSPANRLTSASLRKHGSRESMLSNLSSAASSSAPRAIRAVLQEKEKHLEQLLKERDLDMNEVAQANRHYEDRIQELLEFKQLFLQNQDESKQQLAQYKETIFELEEENKSLKISLEEERKDHEDLLFTYEEEKINQADLQSKLFETNPEDPEDLNALRLIVQQYSDKLKHNEIDLASMKEKFGKQQKQLESTIAENKAQQATIAKLQSEIEANQKQIRFMEESLAAEIVHSQHAIATVERAHSHKLQEVTNFGHRVDELSSKLINSMAEYQELQIEKTKLEDELNQIILSKTVEPGLLESKLRSKEEEQCKLQERIKELQQLNASLTSIWESNVKVIEDGFKQKEADLINTIADLEEKLVTRTETTQKTIESLQLQLGLK